MPTIFIDGARYEVDAGTVLEALPPGPRAIAQSVS
jgi:hypothetical protein